jgi:histidinol phosphatase-like enzyme
MFLAAASLLDIAMDRSLMVGDQDTDLVAASRAGVKTGFLVEGGDTSPFDRVLAWMRQDK